MKAIRYHRYGSADVIALEDVDPPAVGDDDVLARGLDGDRRFFAEGAADRKSVV